MAKRSLAWLAIGLAVVTVEPASAISAALAKKCREMAIKAHPPHRAGTKGYMQAEREYFRVCVEKNGKM
jgi:hypothetical protein